MYRDELVGGIRSARMPESVRDFTLTITPPHFQNRTQALPAFHDEATPDIVSISLRELVKNCQRIKIHGQLGPSFFDASTATEPDKLPWQYATVLEVEVSMNGPDGSWLFDCQQVGDSTNQQPLVSAAQHHLPPGYAATEEEEWEAEDFYDENKDFLDPDEDCSGMESESFSRRSMPDDKRMNILLKALARRCSRSLTPLLERAVFSVQYDADEN
ncbi:hypothetical protein GGR58DRAFT_162176 [Xylaria digitata]|nr:hypothetical protein GGR58DRAFT_162176 [Xylaria digitata]